MKAGRNKDEREGRKWKKNGVRREERKDNDGGGNE